MLSEAIRNLQDVHPMIWRSQEPLDLRPSGAACGCLNLREQGSFIRSMQAIRIQASGTAMVVSQPTRSL